jgi:hypothetical protein
LILGLDSNSKVQSAGGGGSWGGEKKEHLNPFLEVNSNQSSTNNNQ